MINIEQKYIEIIKNILKQYLPNCEIRAFGSRVNGNAKHYSDLDLVILSDKKINIKKLFKAKEVFEYSELPFRVDLIDWNRISDSFKKIIKKNI